MNNNITFNDVANGKTFADWFANQLSSFTPLNVAVALIAALIVSVIIALVYKKTYRGVLYSPSFALTLILLTLVTTPVVMAIGSNVALSMGMVGALSIVRFRTAVKDPLDTAYMFWAITMGILIGSNAYVIAVVAVLAISVIMLAISYLRLRKQNNYLLVLHYDESALRDIESTLKRNTRSYRMRSKTVTRSGAEMTVEVRLDGKVNIVTDMLDIQNVFDATLVACQTEAGA
ncbi:MAG: DUF4956 domain-containing protein [Clostridia bacterium]|nr:DUF4956 domain-containing protein [Clostridia bacterium]MCR4885593.1 DUF4956 domain-containing protein [Clostridiales bacterium]